MGMTGCLSSSQKPASQLQHVLYMHYILLFLAQYFKVVHDYISVLNTTVHHFVGKQGGVPIAFNCMKWHYGLPCVPFARNVL